MLSSQNEMLDKAISADMELSKTDRGSRYWSAEVANALRVLNAEQADDLLQQEQLDVNTVMRVWEKKHEHDDVWTGGIRTHAMRPLNTGRCVFSMSISRTGGQGVWEKMPDCTTAGRQAW